MLSPESSSHAFSPSTSEVFDVEQERLTQMHSAVEKLSTTLARDFVDVAMASATHVQTTSEVVLRTLELHREATRGYLKTVDEMKAQGEDLVSEVQTLQSKLGELKVLGDKVKAAIQVVDALDAAAARL
eukprot:PhM_4_TR15168/c0_g1_i1/m.15509